MTETLHSPKNTAKALLLAATIAAGGLLGAKDAAATTTPITVGTAGNYGILLGTSQNLTFASGTDVTGNLGLGKNDKFTRSGSNSVSGASYQDSGVTTQTNYGTTSISGGVISTSLTNAIADANSASTSAAALTATSSVSSINGSITIKALSNLSENVLNISALSLSNGTITFDDNGYTGAKFIVNVTGAFSVSGTSKIKGINGASADDILFNIEGTGSTVSITGSSSNQIIGTILAPQRNVTLSGGGSLSGALIAGVKNAGQSYTVQTQSGGFDLSQVAYTPRGGSSGGTTGVPEPSSIALFGLGAAALAVIKRRRRAL